MPSIVVDKQVSIDGGLTWKDQDALLQGPTTLAGNNVFFRAIVTDTGPTDLANVVLSDLNGDGLSLSVATLGSHQSATSNTVTLAATAGYHTDSVSVVGTATTGGQSQTTGATDTADYNALVPAITVDKQVSIDGGLDLEGRERAPARPDDAGGQQCLLPGDRDRHGSDHADQREAERPEQRGPVADSGDAHLRAECDLEHGDAGGAAGYHTDSVSVVGTATAGAQSQTTGATHRGLQRDHPGDHGRQAGVDRWRDDLARPGRAAPGSDHAGGQQRVFRAIVTDSGPTTLTNVKLSDLNNEGLSLTVATLATGQSATSNVVSLSAVSGYHTDSVSVVGTATLGGQSQTTSATDTADYNAIVSATPSIGITKTASVATAAAGAPVTYTYKVTNPGSVPITNVQLTDDDATPGLAADDFHPNYVSGDVNSNNKLDPGETWTYTATVTPPVQSYSFAGVTSTGNGNSTGNAVITLENGFIIVQLNNTTPNTRDDAQEITSFTLNLGSPVSSASLTSATGNLISIDTNNGGVVTSVNGTIDHWAVSGSGSTITMNSLSGGKPYDGIIGLPDANGNYPNANSSVLQHLPDIQQSATFVIAAPGVTASTKVTSATFGFGTTSGIVLCGTPSSSVDTNTVVVTGTAGATTLTASATASVVVGTGGPVTPAITIDDQVSLDGVTWKDLGSAVFDNPTTVGGAPVYFRSLVTNTGGTSLANVALTDSNGETLGVTALSAGQSVTSSTVQIAAQTGHRFDTASVVGTASVGGTNQPVSATDTADYTGITPSITIDDQVMLPGGTWQDVGSAVFNNPTTLVNGPVYFRSIVTNTSANTLTGVKLTDGGGETLGLTSLTSGQKTTSSTVQITALSGHNFDTASVTGTLSAGGSTMTVSASDTADYSAVAPKITIDDQVMLPGGTWQDVGSAVFNNPTTMAGGPVYFRSIVTNAGPTTLTGVTLTDTAHETLGVGTLTAGQTVTSSTVSVTAVTGHNFDTASVVGTATAPGITTPIAAADTADYTGIATFQPSIAVSKSANVSSAAPGGQVTYTYKVTNNGTVWVTGLQLSDDGATPGVTADDFAPTLVPGGDTNSNSKLDPGETWTYTATDAPPQKVSFSGTTSGAVTGNALITTGNGYIVVTLINNTPNTGDDAQEITSATFTLGNSVSSASLTSASGKLISVDTKNGGVVTPQSGAIDHWAISGSGSTITMNSLSGGKPYDGIIGLPDANGNYPNANSSVYQHLPDIQQTATFVIAAPGVTTSTKVTAATFGFGTTAGTNLVTGYLSPSVDTNTVTATGNAGGTPVSGTATATVTVGAAAPSSTTNLFSAFTGKANQLEFQYSPGTNIATLSENSVAMVTTTNPGPSSPAFILITDKAGDYDGTAKTYFQGTVSSGAQLWADASSSGGFSTASGSFLYAHVFASQSAYNSAKNAVQEIKYDVSSAHSIALGDTVGSLKLIGYASTTNQGYLV